MGNSTKDAIKWWMLFRNFKPEPKNLWRLYIFSAFVTFLLFLLAAVLASSKHGWGDEPKINCTLLNCEKQAEYWNDFTKKADETRTAAEERLKILKKKRSDPGDNVYYKSWSWFENEIKYLKKVIEENKNYHIYSIRESLFVELALIFFSFVVYLLIGRLVVLHEKSIHKYSPDKNNHNRISNWIIPHIPFSLFISSFMITSEIFTSVLATEKTWFGWGSFCVTPSAFVIKCIGLISFGFVAAVPFTILWCLSRKEYIPVPNASAQDGKFGAERYVEFLQTWTLWLILAPATLGILWIQYVIKMEPQFSAVRLLYSVGVAMIIVIIVFRLIRNAVILRFRCRSSRSIFLGLGNEKKEAVDPTIDFIGTSWWKLPATVGITLASIWAFLDWLGIARIIFNIIK